MKQTLLIKKNRVVLYHVVGWLLYFSLHYIFFNSYRVRFNLVLQLTTWASHLIFFYICYFLLIPLLLFKKKYIPFLLTTLVVFTIFYFAFEYSFRTWGPVRTVVVSGLNHAPGRMTLPAPPPPDSHDRIFIRQHPPSPRFNIIGIYNLFFFFTASMVIRFMQRWNEEEKIKTDSERIKTKAELDFLKRQVNPHFLFNALNSIYSLSMSKSDKTTDAVLRMSSILRYMLYETDNKLVTLSNELDIVRNYIELQRLRITEKVTVSLNVVGGFENYKIEPLLIIPILENAFKYGVDNVNESFIDISIVILYNKLDFTVRNKIVNISPINTESSGIGLKNIRRRLDLLYPDDYLFETNEEDKIFTVRLQIRLKK